MRESKRELMLWGVMAWNCLCAMLRINSKCLLPCLLWFYLCYKQTMEPFSIGSGILPCYSAKAGTKKFIHCHVFCPCLWTFLLVYKGWLKYLLTYYLILWFPKEHSTLFYFWYGAMRMSSSVQCWGNISNLNIPLVTPVGLWEES